MVIYDGDMGAVCVSASTQGLLYALWDLGFRSATPFEACRTVWPWRGPTFPAARRCSRRGSSSGDRRLFNRFRKVLAENVYQKDFAQFLETTLAERDQRYRKFGGSPYMGEPNVKESAGGLRDIHTAMWLASTKFGTRTLRELSDKRLITAREQASADEALTFLWRVRNELHFLSGHKNDVLSRDIQPQIAKNFGYDERRGSRWGREVHARLLPARAGDPPGLAPPHRPLPETLSRRGAVQRRLRQDALADGLIVIDGQLHLADPDGRAFREDPVRLMKVFWHCTGSAASWAGRRARRGGLARPGRRRVPALARGPRSVPRHLPEWGRVTPDPPRDARARAARALPARVGRADLPRPVRRLSQVHRRPALAARRGEPRGARAGPVGGVRSARRC